ncbi:TlpA disulfide reductase family protein [Aquimarina brevivitae]|uniref:Peroxiredoxin n=1 Tax=Aquimarina brevivitae TaxID=323412 RepID=A0A4Q7NUI8_9FLAO|nr:TlpA disulfide reductase family protein [Aquimarina brevivitae]RZS90518.1 peroxiredoxin [Aquimarina brevivitae]
MTRFIITLFTLTLFVSCQKEKKGYFITADTNGFEDGTMVYVNAMSQSNRPFVIDSVTINDGKFELALPTPETNDFNYLTFQNTGGNVLYIAENNPIRMEIFKDSLRSSVVKGGEDNQVFFEYLAKLKAFANEKVATNNEIHIATKLKEFDKVKQLRLTINDINQKELDYRKELAEKYPNSLVSVMALTDLIRLNAIKANEAQQLYTSISAPLKNTRLGKQLDRLVTNAITLSKQKKIDVGDKAEDFSAPTPTGNELSLTEAMGKVTIIDFWASWCKPCRMENPNVVNVYNKYHDKGLNIIGVSLDKKKESWIKAIQDDNLQWNHVSNLQFWQEPIAKAYGVRSIPATFIVNEEGKVIAKNLRGPALEEKIAELLGADMM